MKIKIDDLLSMIKENSTIEEIKDTLQLSDKELMYGLKLLRNKGISVDKDFYVGDLNRLAIKEPFSKFPNGVSLYTDKDANTVRMMIISDIHMFHKNDSIDALHNLYEYCAKNGIDTIVICGDLIDAKEHQDRIPVSRQGEEFIKCYPYDKNISNIALMGNHEVLFFKETGVDFNNFLENERIDFKTLGYRNGFIYIKNDYINISHYINDCVANVFQNFGSRLRFSGHSHIAKLHKHSCHVPSISNVSAENLKSFGFIPRGFDVTFDFGPKGVINTACIDQVMLSDIPFIISETIIHSSYNSIMNDSIEYEKNSQRTLSL